MFTALALAGALLASDTEVAVTLKDGSNLHGTTNVAKLQLTADWGKATVAMAKVRSIAFGSPATVETQDGTTLRGTLTLRVLDLTTSKGRKRHPVDTLASLSVISRAKLVPGALTGGTAANGVTYCVRVPKSYRPGKAWPTLLVFHGSNMNTNGYVNTIARAWPGLAADYVLLGINGERRNTRFPPDDPRYNYTYVNWVGPRSTMRGTNPNESPKFVMEVLKEVQAFLPMSRVFVGGHSQGGFLTYVVYQHYPESFAGAFPMSCGMIYQAEPTAFENAKIRLAQRARPLAILHGRSDRTVRFSMSEYARSALIDDGFETVRLFAPAKVGHSFSALPLEKAIRWLETFSSADAARLVRFGTAAAKAGDWRDAVAAANRARSVTKGRPGAKLKALLGRIDAACKPRAEKLARTIGVVGDNSWVDAFLKFRDELAFADAAKPCMAAYAELRAKHAKPANKIYLEARRDFNAGKDDDAYAKCQEIVDRYYASRRYATVKGWLDKRGK